MLVAIAPTHTSDHCTFASGRILKIAANNKAITTRETINPAACNNPADNPDGSTPLSATPAAASTALIASDVNSRKATPRIIPKDERRLPRNALTPPTLGSGLTCQTLFSASCSDV